MFTKLSCLLFALILVWCPEKGNSQIEVPKGPIVYVLYSSGQVFSADYLYFGKTDKKGKADFRTLFFTVVDSCGDSLSHRLVHFVDIKYILFKPEWWPRGIEYVKENFARENPVFLPIALVDGSMSKVVFEEKERPHFYLKVFKNETIGTSTRRKYLGRDFLFNPDDNYGDGRLLVIATTPQYLEEAKQAEFVRQILRK